MKKKILLVAISLALTFTLVPCTSSGASFNPEIKSQKPAYEKVNGGYIITNVRSTLDMYKQVLLDMLDETYELYVKDESDYLPQVWKLINNISEKEEEHIRNADSADELLEASFLFMIPNPESMAAFNKIQNLGSLTKDVVKKESDYKTLKKQLKTYVKNSEGFYDRNAYNDYYWSIIENNYAEVLAEVEAISSLEDYADAYAMAMDYGLYSENPLGEGENAVGSFRKVNKSIKDYIAAEDEGDEDGDNEYYDFYPVDIFYIDFYGGVYAEFEMDELRENLNLFLDVYINKQLAISGYDQKTDELSKMVESAKTRMAKMYDAEEMYSEAVNTYLKLVKITGIEMQTINDNMMNDLRDEIDSLFKKYNKEDYSVQNWAIMEEAYYIVRNSIEYEYVFRAQLPVDITGTLKKKLDSVPKYDKELKQLKSSYIKELKAYKGNKRYNQKKVEAIVNEGINKIKEASTIEDVENLYFTYFIKAEKTVKKYKITTSKEGKGVITKTKAVQYGQSVTIKISPSPGYKISKVVVDGKRKKLKNKYVFNDINANHKIKVIFSK